jgi:hypothetical protein
VGESSPQFKGFAVDPIRGDARVARPDAIDRWIMMPDLLVDPASSMLDKIEHEANTKTYG